MIDYEAEIKSLERAIAHADNACRELIETYGHGVRPSYVSEDLAHYGERAERYRRQIARIRGQENG